MTSTAETKRDPLTLTQRLVFDFICDRLDGEGIPPSQPEVQEYMGYKSPNAVTVIYKALERKGWVRIIPKKSRGIIPLSATIKSGKCKDIQMTV